MAMAGYAINLAKGVARRFGIEISRHQKGNYRRVSLRSRHGCNGIVLLSYTINPFLLKEGDTFTSSHITDWQCFEIASAFLDLGYNVDVIAYTDYEFIPKKDYIVCIDVLNNLERLYPYLNKECIKIFHPAWAHWISHNTNQYVRHLGLRERRQISIRPKLMLEPSFAIEYADYVTCRGGEFCCNTYKFAGKAICNLPHSAVCQYPWPEQKNYDRCRKNFLWLGGFGLLHKGLDLVLDAFKEMPEYHLTICGPIDSDTELKAAYYSELYETANIHTVGWIDVMSPEFIKLSSECIGIVYLSCSELIAGSVVTCLHAGMIPIVSYESGIEVNDFGILLHDVSIAEIKKAIGWIAELPASELELMSKNAWEYVRAHHTLELFRCEYRKVIRNILDKDVMLIG
jgi:glycosyltransferase involved in cell wall biosynthesis